MPVGTITAGIMLYNYGHVGMPEGTEKNVAEDPDTYAHFNAISTINPRACHSRVRLTNTVASSILNMASRPPEVNTMPVMWSIKLSLRN